MKLSFNSWKMVVLADVQNNLIISLEEIEDAYDLEEWYDLGYDAYEVSDTIISDLTSTFGDE